MDLASVLACATLGLVGAVAAPESPASETVFIARPLYVASLGAPSADADPAAGARPAVPPGPGAAGVRPVSPAEALAAPRPAAPAPVPTALPGEHHPAPGSDASAPLAPAPPAFMDPRTFAWQQRRIPPADMAGVESACGLGLVLGDGRCLRERIIDYVFHWPCPGRCAQGNRAVATPP